MTKHEEALWRVKKQAEARVNAALEEYAKASQALDDWRKCERVIHGRAS